MVEINISVILPVYKPSREELIRSLGSIPLNATCKYEVVLVDDGNDLETKDIIWNVCSYYPQVLVLSKEREGLFKAISYGVGYARGSYVTILKAGDELEAGALDKVWSILEKRRPKLFIAGTVKDSGHSLPIEETLPIQVLPDQVLRFGPEAGIPLERLRIYYMTQRDSRLSHGGVSLGAGIEGRFLERSFCLENPFPEGLPMGEELLWNLSLLRSTRQPLLSLLPCYVKKRSGERGYIQDYPRHLAVYFTALRREMRDWPVEIRTTYYAHSVQCFTLLCKRYVFAREDGQERERFHTELTCDLWQKVFARVNPGFLSARDRTIVSLKNRGMEGALYRFCRLLCKN